MTQAPGTKRKVDWQRWMSAIALLSVGLLFLVAQGVLDVDPKWLPDSAASSRATGPRVGHHIALRAQWGAVLYVSTAFMLALALYSGSVILKAGWKKTCWVLAVMAVLVVTVGYLIARSPFIPPSMYAQLEWIAAASGFDAPKVVRAYVSGVFATNVIVVVAIAALLSPSPSSDRLRALMEATRHVRHLLTLATGWLVSGVIAMALLHRMGEASVQLEFAPSLREVNLANTIFVGAFYSLALASVFVPAQLGLRRLALDHYTRTDGQQKWLEDNGFVLSFPKTLSGILAIFSPLIASVIEGIAKLS